MNLTRAVNSGQRRARVARWKGRRTREVANYLERKRGLASPPFDVAEFILFESRLSRHGAHYEEVEGYALA